MIACLISESSSLFFYINHCCHHHRYPHPYSKIIKNIKMKYSTIFVLLVLNIQIAFILDHDTCLVLERVLQHEDKGNQYSVITDP